MIEYVEGSDGIAEFYERLTPLLDYLLPAYEQEGKAHLTVGHRLHRRPAPLRGDRRAPGARVRARGDLLIDVVHRDMDKPPRRP